VPAEAVVHELFDEWAASYVRGESPDPLAFIKRAGSQGDALAELMDAFLEIAPVGEPSEETLLLARAWVSGASPLVALRVSRGVRREQVVDAVMGAFGLAAERREKVKGYYHDLESGQIAPRGLDLRLVDLLAQTLQATRDAILNWRPRTVEAAPAYRTAEGQELMRDLPAPVPSPAMPDEVDRLFGRDSG
jgi:hypothetical protein